MSQSGASRVRRGAAAGGLSGCSDVAIVGLAFRFPGDLFNEAGFWQALRDRKDLIGTIPSDRWAVGELCHPRRGEAGRSVTFSAGVLSRIDEFDASFFGISPREAAWLDPQQRLLLELAWEATENAGIPASALAGSDCAVYVGMSSLDYGTRGLDDLASLSAYSMTGNTLSVAANRLSYVFDLHGPSLVVDTACSSSLVALHHACNSLRSGEASTALVGGVNLLLHPYPFVGFTKASMLSAGGRCKPFDASGDGYVRSEGGAVLILKPLEKALADGDEIHAVILASGVNADGARKTGITIPSSAGQAELMREVLARSGLAADEVDFVEAHGTGTAVGDPVEAAAIGQVYGCARSRPLPIGSVKANLGHLEPASGMAGLIKAVLALKNRALPPALHLDKPNSHIDFAGLNLELVTEYRALEKQNGRALVAGVNSFGFGGANSHVLLQEYTPVYSVGQAGLVAGLPPLFISARGHAALKALAGNYAALLDGASPEAFYDLAHAAAYRRDRLDSRLALSAATLEEARESLSRYAAGEMPRGLVVEDALPEAGDVAFVYSGNGAQWVGMGRAMLAGSTRFAEILAGLDEQMRVPAGFSLLLELQADGDAARLDDTVVAQPLLFAIQVAVTMLLRERGVEATAVCGHSVGEVAAAWAAGALSLEQGIRVICARSRAQGLTRGAGRMAAVGLSVQAMRAVLAESGGDADIEIAGINSPDSITISGSLDGLQRLRGQIEARGVFFRLLDLDYAFHSRHMDPIASDLAGRLDGLVPERGGQAVFVSTVTGDVLDAAALGAGYWWRNVREPVRFADGVARLAALGCRVFVEIGPHAILQRYITECLGAGGLVGRALPTLRRNDDAPERITDTALRALLLNRRQNLEACFPRAGRRVRLPNYPWQRERHWHPATSEGLRAILRRRVHPLLGWPLPEAEAAWENVVDPVLEPWLADHRVGGAIVFPGAAYLELALAAAREWCGGDAFVVEQLDIVAPMVFDGEHARSVHLIVNPRDGGFQIRSRQRLGTDEWVLHAAGRLLEATGRGALPVIPAPEVHARCVAHETHYRLAESLGLDYGPAFRGLQDARVDGALLEARVALPDALDGQSFLLHPAVMDLCFQSLVVFFDDAIAAGRGIAFLPVKVGRLDVVGHDQVTSFRARLKRGSARSVVADFELLDSRGGLLARASGCRFRAAPLKRHDRQVVSAWETRVVPLPHPVDAASASLPALPAMLDSMRTGLAARAGERLGWFRETLPLVEALTLSFAHQAMLGLALAHPDDWRARLATPHARWMAALLEEEGLVEQQGGRAVVLAEPDLPPADELWRVLLQDAPACLPQLALLGRVGARLPELLRGGADAGALVRELRHSPIAEARHDDDPAYLGTRLAAEALLRKLTGELPAGRKLRVLELAAGSSELPRVLAATGRNDAFDYVLAVPDEEVRARQHAEYHEQPGVAVVHLDASSWTLTAGQALPAPFDVVIVRHCLHRASDPRGALAQVRAWLARGGVVLLAERYPDWSADFLEGLDPAWWQQAEGEALDSLPHSSLRSPVVWQQALVDAGFNPCEVLTETAGDGLAVGAYLLLARKPDEDAADPVVPEAGTTSWLLQADEASVDLAQRLRGRLEAEGQQVVVTTEREDVLPEGLGNLVCLRGWNDTSDKAGQGLAELMHDVQALGRRSAQAPRLWCVTRGGAMASGVPAGSAPTPWQAARWGFGRVVMNEFPALGCTLVDLACDPAGPDTPLRLGNELLRPDGASEIILSAGARHGVVLDAAAGGRSTAASEGARFRLDFHVAGQLRNLVWLPGVETPLGEGDIEVQTRATGLNFRDVMYLMGLLPDEAVENGFAGASLGLEFSGVVSRVGSGVRDLQPGDAVMGFGASCFASHVLTRADAVARMPEEWTFEAAATVPTVFLTVYYALRQLANLQPGERVLIHGAAGGVGIAAIQLARHIGAEVFATAGSAEKRDFVKLLGADHVFDSRSLAFADDVLAATGGDGVDVVLNSLAGEAMRRSLDVLRPFGRFLELGKRDFFENTPLGLRPFKSNISYFGIDADQLLTGRPQLAARLFREVIELFREGALSPLPHRVFTTDRVVDAFRVMQQARHVGKIVLSLEGARPLIEQHREAHPEVPGALGGCWLVTGGLSGFGLASARRLADLGVGRLILVGRRGTDTPGAGELLAEFEARGVEVLVEACDVTDGAAVAALIARAGEGMPPLSGVLHAAASFDDRLIANLDVDGLQAVLAPKLLGAWNLHQATLTLPITHFVLYSSVTTVIGNPGQGNYVAANAGLEGLAALRCSMGLPVHCIAWGPIGDAGYLTRHEAVKDSLSQRLGRPPLEAEEALAGLAGILAGPSGLHTLANFDWSALSRLLPSSGCSRFAALNQTLGEAAQVSDIQDIRALIAGRSPGEITELVRGLVVQEVAQILSVGAERIEPHRSLHDLGMDSLMAVELALGLEQRFGIQLPVMMLNDAPTVDKVSARIIEKLTGGEGAGAPETVDALVAGLVQQHGESMSPDEIKGLADEARALTRQGARLTE